MANQLNSAIELHDSVLGSIKSIEGSLLIELLPAYIHRSFGEPGVDAGQGFTQDFVLEVENGRCESIPGELPADIIDGDLQVESSNFRNTIKLPCEVVGALRLTIILADNRIISISGNALTATEAGVAVYVEEFVP